MERQRLLWAIQHNPRGRTKFVSEDAKPCNPAQPAAAVSCSRSIDQGAIGRQLRDWRPGSRRIGVSHALVIFSLCMFGSLMPVIVAGDLPVLCRV